MTPNKEDYLKAIYKLSSTENPVSNKRIAESLLISPASVTEMLGKLKREGLVFSEPYRGSRLTDEGMRVAISLVRGHRLWEVFLMRHLGYSWSEAHEDAELLEHITPSRLTSRLDQFLNYPAYCPHGSAIPLSDGEIAQPSLTTLNNLPIGALSTIRRVTEEKALLDYLEESGIVIGSPVQVVERAQYEGPVTLKINDRTIQISYKAACQIFIDKADTIK